MDYENELNKLRNEFLRREEDAEALWRVQHAEDYQGKPAITVHPNAMFEDGPKAHGYTMTITFNLYATLNEIRDALIKEVMGRIESNQKLLYFDNPESNRPEFPQGKGKRSPETQIEELKTCLDVFDKINKGMTNEQIAREIYDADPEDLSWDSDCRKVSHKKNKALALIEAAKNGSFPNIKE